MASSRLDWADPVTSTHLRPYLVNILSILSAPGISIRSPYSLKYSVFLRYNSSISSGVAFLPLYCSNKRSIVAAPVIPSYRKNSSSRHDMPISSVILFHALACLGIESYSTPSMSMSAHLGHQVAISSLERYWFKASCMSSLATIIYPSFYRFFRICSSHS